MKKLFILMLVLLGFAYAQADKYVIIAGDDVCLRSCASESCKITGQPWAKVNTGEVYNFLGETDAYYAISIHGGKYFIPKKYGRLRVDEQSSYSSVVIAGDDVCLRSCASESCKITGQPWAKVNTGEYYEYMGEKGNYYGIWIHGGTYYIPKKYGRLR